MKQDPYIEDHLIKNIYYYIFENNISQADFAVKLGMTPNHLSIVLNKHKPMSKVLFRKLQWFFEKEAAPKK